MGMDLSGFIRKKTTIKIGTKEFTFTELNLADIAAFKGHLIKQRKAANEERRERLVELAKKIGSVDPMELLKLTDSTMSEDEFESQLDSLAGVGHLAYLSLKYAHPEISKEDVMGILTPGTFDEILGALYAEELIDKSPTKKKVRMRSRLKKSPNQRR